MQGIGQLLWKLREKEGIRQSRSAGNWFFSDWSNYGTVGKIGGEAHLYIAKGHLQYLWIASGDTTENLSKKMGRSKTMSAWIWEE